jgi:hypothetical protein
MLKRQRPYLVLQYELLAQSRKMLGQIGLISTNGGNRELVTVLQNIIDRKGSSAAEDSLKTYIQNRLFTDGKPGDAAIHVCPRNQTKCS